MFPNPHYRRMVLAAGPLARWRPPFLRGGLLALLGLALLASAASAVTPESAEVKAVVDKGLKFLETATHDQIGGKCLVGIIFKQHGRELTHPKIKEAIDACKNYAQKGDYGAENYNLALSIVFLCETEDPALRPVVQKLLTDLLKRQKPEGGWGYQTSPLGDTSQTQFGILAIWMADRHGFEVPVTSIENALNWLIRTQDINGGWGYQGQEPMGAPRNSQSPLTMSLGGAALGSVYILTDMLNIPGANFQAQKNGADGKKLPSALQEVQDPAKARREGGRRASNRVDAGRLKAAMNDGKKFMAGAFTHNIPDWKYYAYYAYERFQSFREVTENDIPAEPQWYTDLYNDLKKLQGPDGSWTGGDTPTSSTAFSVLVLTRSTRKAIKRAEMLGEGVLLGGMGLPTNTADLKERNGKLVETPLAGTVDELLSIIDDDSNPELSRMAESNQVVALDSDVTRRAGQITRLRNMVSAGAFETRLIAVRSLAKVRDFDNVPVLLYALSDPDLRVVREADKGLRFISRKFEGVVSLDAPTKEILAELRQKWRTWYLSIRPDAELLD
jgi:hypothetical protein